MGDTVTRKLLVLDSAYTHRMMAERKILTNITCRDASGYFERVWTVHPVASLLLPETDKDRFGSPEFIRVSEVHTIIEGKIGRFRWLRRAPRLNFLLAQLQLVRMLLRLVRRERVSLIRSEDPLYNGLVALFLSWWRRLPLVIGVFGNPGEHRRQTGRPIMPRLFRSTSSEERVERFVLRRADCAIAQNEDNRQFIVDQGVRPERTEIFRLGNLLHPVHFTDPHERPGGDEELEKLGAYGVPSMIVITRLESLKFPDHVVLAAASLKRRGRPVKALMVGDGTMRGELERLAESLQVSDQIVFCGNRDQEWLACVLPRVSVIVSPGMGRALAEAALAGVPAAAYDIDWQPDLVETGVTGELVPYLDSEAMADAVERLLDDPAGSRRMGAALRRRTLEMMDPAKIEETQIAVYDALIRGAYPPGSSSPARTTA